VTPIVVEEPSIVSQLDDAEKVQKFFNTNGVRLPSNG
jgi:hypothetical protein